MDESTLKKATIEFFKNAAEYEDAQELITSFHNLYNDDLRLNIKKELANLALASEEEKLIIELAKSLLNQLKIDQPPEKIAANFFC